VTARETARQFPIYIFPDTGAASFSVFTGHRHAPVIDLSHSASGPFMPTNPLSMRVVLVVNYTSNTFTDDGHQMMKFFGAKNGWATDRTAILKTVDDIRSLENQGYVTVSPLPIPNADAPVYTLAHVLTNPTSGAIYPDAFLSMNLMDGQQLASEQIFVQQFNCLQKLGIYCPAAPSN
jgi:hypothetical protein